jgi:ATP-dependent exoDNAse (exonuclease V) beta subunit
VRLDAGAEEVHALAHLEGRIIGAPNEEVDAAASLVTRVLAHSLLHDAREAEARGACRREVPVTLTLESGLLLEGVVDLAFERDGGWTVVDFKTDEDPTAALEAYRRQVGLYASAIGRVATDRGAGLQPCETPRGFVLVV